MKLYRDEAGNSTANFTWFFDQYNNLIGVTKIAADTNYGVINRIWWAGNAADGTGTAQANVTYMDGTTGTVTISDMTFMGGNDSVIGTAYSANMKNGTPTYSTDVDDLMRIMPKTGPNTAVVDDGYFYVSPYYATNEQADNRNGNGIVDDHLFQFTAQADGTVAAKEVAGASTDNDGLANVTTAVSKDSTSKDLLADSNTVFLVRSVSTTDTYVYTSITGINNIGSYNPGEVDYVDMDGDKVAEYVYISASSVDSEVDVLFYYADGQGSYNATTKIYTIPGYIDGVAGNLTTTNENIYNTILGTKYALYNVTIKNGEATAINNGGIAYNTAENGTYVTDTTNNNNYAAYEANELLVTTITGATGDKWSNNLYTDASNGWTYVTNDNTKVYGEWATDMSDKNVILVWTGNGAETNGLILQAYIVDQSTVVNPVTINRTTVSVVSPGAVANEKVNDVKFTATGTDSNSQTYNLDTSAVWEVREAGKTEFRACTENEVFVSGNTYRATITISVPDDLAGSVTIPSTNAITYTDGGTTGTGTTVQTDAFVK